MGPDELRVPTFHRACERHFAPLALLVLALAAFNLTYRLDREVVTDWDESLYAISASEMAASNHWIGVTYLGELDYYNSKPPLNVWLISLAFKAFGITLWSLRLVSVTAALLTVFALIVWGRRCFNAAVGLTAGVVLSTTFAFLYVHAARSANTDALFTLFVLLTAIVLWAGDENPWTQVWLGVLLAATFLLRGMAVLMPLSMVACVRVWRGTRSRTPSPMAMLATVCLFAAPVMLWAIARWRLDGPRFFEVLLGYDFIARTRGALEGHEGSPIYYVQILAKHHYDWLLAALAAVVLFPMPWQRIRTAFTRDANVRDVVLIAWTANAILIPTSMPTKLPWYLNSFYPVFALAIAWLVIYCLTIAATTANYHRRGAALALIVATMLGVAETKLHWYSFHYRDLRR
ncbi:MAG TPA: glycosyltransferase family 39 protein, partial [Vicinamibacterales bacterium]|nr:glycosyltransferase family 39 protein [Vicinamibacterales bacterium]